MKIGGNLRRFEDSGEINVLIKKLQEVERILSILLII